MEKYIKYANFKRDGEEYVILNKCINECLIKDNEFITMETVDNINSSLKKFNESQYKVIDAYLETKGYQINSIKEVIDLLENIEDYKLLEVNNKAELGKLILSKMYGSGENEELIEFIDLDILAEKYLTKNNVKYTICSNGILLNIKNMYANDVLDNSIKPEHRIMLLVTNKEQYNEYKLSKRLELLFPMTNEKLKEKLEMLDIKENNVKVLECAILNLYPQIRDDLTLVMERIVSTLGDEEKEISLFDVQALAVKMQEMDNVEITKLIAILEHKEEDINSFKDIIKLTEEINKYELLSDIKTSIDMGKYLVNETGYFDDVSLLKDYIDYGKLANDYTRNGCVYSGTFTEVGYLMEKESFELEQNEGEEFE